MKKHFSPPPYRKGFLYVLLLLISYLPLFAQTNLIRDPGFEDNTFCPVSYSDDNLPLWDPNHDQLNKCLPGNWITATLGTPDYFHKCAPVQSCNRTNTTDPTAVAVDVNLFGIQTHNPLSPTDKKEAYTGFIIGGLSANPGTGVTKEYIMQEIGPGIIQAGQRYYVSFWVSLAEGSYFALNNIGAWVTNSALTYPVPVITDLGVTPQVLDSRVIDEVNGWVRISGSFVASGTEDRIIIGHFTSTGYTVQPRTRSNACYSGTNWTYYYVDDVSLSVCECNEPALVTTFNKVLAFTNPPSPDSCYYTLDITSNEGACNVKSVKITDATTGTDVLGFTSFNDGIIASGSGFHSNVIRQPDYLSVAQFTGKKIIRTVFYDAEGRELCAHIDTLESCDCCHDEYYNVSFAPKTSSPMGQCCWYINFATTPQACDISGIKIISPTGMVLLPKTDFPGGVIRAGEIRNQGVSGFCLESFSGSKPVTIILYDAHGIGFCSLSDTLTGCNCLDSACKHPGWVSVRTVKNTGDDCCWDIYVKNTGACDLLFNNGFALGTDKPVTSATGDQWQVVFDGAKAIWSNPAGNIIKAGEEIHMGSLCVNTPDKVKIWEMVADSFKQNPSGSITIWACMDSLVGELVCKCIDTACNHLDWIDMRTVKYTNSTGGCCWKVYAKNTGPCDLLFTKGIGIGTDKLIASSSNGNWNIVFSSGGSVQWASSSTGSSTIKKGEEVYLGDFCVNSDAGRVKVWKLVDDCGDDPIEDVGCNCSSDGCDSVYMHKLKARIVKVSGSGNECCFDLYIKNTDACDLNLHKGIMLDNSNTTTQITGFSNGEWVGVNRGAQGIWWRKKNTFNTILQSGQEVFVGRFCAKNNSSTLKLGFTISLLRDNFPADPYAYCNGYIFDDSLSCDTPVVSCCDNLYALLERVGGNVSDPNCFCKFNVKISGFYPSCAVYDIRFANTGDGSLTQWFSLPAPINFSNGPFNMATLCIPATVAGAYTYRAKIVVQFLDSNGVVLCNKLLEDSCVQGGSGGGINFAKTGAAVTDLANKGVQPEQFAAYPNPFNEELNIRYSLKKDTRVSIDIYDISGRHIATIEDQHQQPAGDKVLNYNTAHLAKGMYLVRLTTNEGTSVIQVVK